MKICSEFATKIYFLYNKKKKNPKKKYYIFLLKKLDSIKRIFYFEYYHCFIIILSIRINFFS